MSRAAVASEAMALEPGQSMRVVCPFCGGGSSKERSMSIKLDPETGLVLYHCFRGNCEEGSGVLGGAKLVRTRQDVPKFQPYDMQYLVSLFDAPLEVFDKLEEWGLKPEDHLLRHWRYDTYTERMAQYVAGPNGDHRGYVLRAHQPWVKTKALTARLRNDCPFQGWVNIRSIYRPIVCVEDLPSAVRVGMAGYRAVALLGNTPSNDALDEIAEEAREFKVPVLFALDPDATAQAMRVSRKFGMRGDSSVLVLHKDFKNMKQEEVNECLMNANWYQHSSETGERSTE